MPTPLPDEVNDILPQTQCTRCGYPSCRDYAVALVNGEAEINQCPPGGDEGIAKLAKIFNKPVLPLNPANGTLKPRQIAVIEEDVCIGCTLCIKACPVDAILGSNKMMHTVITDLCTGCDLCIPVCPVDCIIMVDAEIQAWTQEDAQAAKLRYEQRNLRRLKEQQEREERLKQQSILLKRNT